MVSRRGEEQLAGVADAALRSLGSRPRRTLTSGMTETPVSKPESPRASLGKSSRARPSIVQGLPCVVEQRLLQARQRSGWIATS